MATNQRVLVTYGGYAIDHPDCGGALSAAGLELDLQPLTSDRTPSELSALVGEAVAAIADNDPFDASVIAKAKQLRIIARTGVGVDRIDLDAATAAGVLVSVTPGVNHETVADHALLLMLAVVRRMHQEHKRVRAGGWRDFASPLGQLHGRTVGLIGFGAIGQAVGRRLQAFGVELLVHDPFVAADRPEHVELEELLRRSDVVSLHLPLSPDTAHLIDERRIGSMKQGAVLINTARGGLVHQKAVVSALRSGHLGGAGLDVFEVEPPADSDLLGFEQVVLSPHIGGISDASNLAMSRLATDSVFAALRGETTQNVINSEALANRA